MWAAPEQTTAAGEGLQDAINYDNTMVEVQSQKDKSLNMEYLAGSRIMSLIGMIGLRFCTAG
jgi:hypothetical protein